mmetsp:Transcript_59670/g.194685  ORF Transcript_59670/g.194685 Transcript_59670/m.194685 type:complete len:146 (-) Transcript_59670:101-538(-)
MDSKVLKRTKVALELNSDFWKKSDAPEVRQMVSVLVKEWKNMYRGEQGTAAASKPRVFSQRTLRNAATDLEESAHGKTPLVEKYQDLVRALLGRLAQVPDQAIELLDGGVQAPAFVGRVHKAALAQEVSARVKRPKLDHDPAKKA